MAETTLKIEMDTTQCLELIEKHKQEFRGRITVQSVMDYLSENEERIKWQLGGGWEGRGYRLD